MSRPKMMILLSMHFLLVLPALALAQGYASVSGGVNVSPSPVTVGQNFAISFTLKEVRGASKTFENVAIAILRSDNSFVFDFAMYSNVTIGAYGSWSKTATNYLYATQPAGTYKAVIRGKYQGQWFDFDTTGSGGNPKSFTAVSSNRAPEGWLDAAGCTSLVGWTRDPDTSAPIKVHVYADGPAGSGGRFITEATADVYRSDLPFSDKNHGFNVPVPAGLKDGSAHGVYVYALDNAHGPNPLLNGSPKSISCTTVGYASVAGGVNVAPTPVVLGQNFTVNFTLQEVRGAPKTLENIAVAILRADNSFVFDFAMYGSVTLGPYGTWSQTATNKIFTDKGPGTYKAVIRGKYQGQWFDFDTTGAGVNPRSFTVVFGISDDHGNDCGSATSLSVNSSINGNLERAGDYDFFKVQTTSSGTLSVFSSGSTDTFGYLKNASCSDITSDDDSGEGSNSHMSRALGAGTYYVAVRHHSATGTGPYVLKAEFSGSPPAGAVNWNVPYLRQKDYANNMKESACAPTSLAMLLRFYYPNSNINMPEIYHSGTQQYSYRGGPAQVYRNVSFAAGDSGLSIIPVPYRSYYSGRYSGASAGRIRNYLGKIWGIQTATLNEDGVYQAIRQGPVLGHVYGHGNTHWGHYLVIRGIDDRGTPNDRSDDVVYVNDPYDVWNRSWDTGGNNKAIGHREFFVTGARFGNRWFRDATQLLPQESSGQSSNTVVVDTGHNNCGSGNSSVHVFSLDNASGVKRDGQPVWRFVYGGEGGDWYYPTENGHRARWKPRLATSGNYEVSVRFRGDSASGSVQYTIFNAQGQALRTVSVSQHRAVPTWSNSVIAAQIRLENGCYVRAANIPANTNVDAVKFKYLGN